jgi:hypothetical protein
MAQWFNCTVNRAGPAADATEYPPPVIYINLTDQAGSFGGQWFFAASNAKNEMLAVALSAISLGKTVNASLDPPVAGGTPYTECYRFYIQA